MKKTKSKKNDTLDNQKELKKITCFTLSPSVVKNLKDIAYINKITASVCVNKLILFYLQSSKKNKTDFQNFLKK